MPLDGFDFDFDLDVSGGGGADIAPSPQSECLLAQWQGASGSAAAPDAGQGPRASLSGIVPDLSLEPRSPIEKVQRTITVARAAAAKADPPGWWSPELQQRGYAGLQAASARLRPASLTALGQRFAASAAYAADMLMAEIMADLRLDEERAGYAVDRAVPMIWRHLNALPPAVAEPLTETFARYLDDLTAADLATRSPRLAAIALAQMQPLWRHQRKIDIIERALGLAEDTTAAGLQRAFQAIVADPARFARFVPAEQGLIDEIAAGSVRGLKLLGWAHQAAYAIAVGRWSGPPAALRSLLAAAPDLRPGDGRPAGEPFAWHALLFLAMIIAALIFSLS